MVVLLDDAAFHGLHDLEKPPTGSGWDRPVGNLLKSVTKAFDRPLIALARGDL